MANISIWHLVFSTYYDNGHQHPMTASVHVFLMTVQNPRMINTKIGQVTQQTKTKYMFKSWTIWKIFIHQLSSSNRNNFKWQKKMHVLIIHHLKITTQFKKRSSKEKSPFYPNINHVPLKMSNMQTHTTNLNWKIYVHPIHP